MSQLGIGRPSPRYVERGGDVVYRPPFRARDASMWMFLVEADIECLAEVCRRTFTYPTDGAVEVVPIGPYVVVTFVNIRELGSGPPDDRLGTLPELESSLWFPVLDTRRNRFVWHVPYMFVDGRAAMAGGREIYGFPKNIARLGIPGERDVLPEKLSVRTLALERFRRDERGSEHLVYSVSRRGRRPMTREEASGPASRADRFFVEPPGALRSDLRSRRPDPNILAPSLSAGFRARSLLGALRGRGTLLQAAEVLLLFLADFAEECLPMLNLKQFRSSVSSELACYQAVVEVRNTIEGTPVGGPIPDDYYQLTFRELDSEPICRDLGIRSGPQTPAAALWLDFGFDIDPGDVLWEASPL